MRPWMMFMTLTLMACAPEVADRDGDGVPDEADPITTVGTITGPSGLLQITLASLAIEPEGTTVRAEIVLDGAATGIMAPTTIEVAAREHTVTTLRAGFISPPVVVSVADGETTTVQSTLGRDLTGGWKLTELRCEPPPSGQGECDSSVTMVFGEYMVDWRTGNPTTKRCPTQIFALNGHYLCLLPEDALRWSVVDPNSGVVGRDSPGQILDNGERFVYFPTDDPSIIFRDAPCEWWNVYDRCTE
ncbi:MAG: hypothetical protein Q7S96_02190 [bacterium]|nr:hypothetical protein [bacterium]